MGRSKNWVLSACVAMWNVDGCNALHTLRHVRLHLWLPRKITNDLITHVAHEPTWRQVFMEIYSSNCSWWWIPDPLFCFRLGARWSGTCRLEYWTNVSVALIRLCLFVIDNREADADERAGQCCRRSECIRRGYLPHWHSSQSIRFTVPGRFGVGLVGVLGKVSCKSKYQS